MTANGRFVRAAANQGVHYSVFLHQPRALTEAKEYLSIIQLPSGTLVSSSYPQVPLAAASRFSLTLVDDRPSQRTRRLAASAKVTPRSLSIFGTGDSLRAVTMTANGRFVRAAANQGVHYSVFLHQPRALTEAKEWRATPV
ncbi:UPF0415 protein C7orf25 homolog [Menidia menidia]